MPPAGAPPLLDTDETWPLNDKFLLLLRRLAVFLHLTGERRPDRGGLDADERTACKDNKAEGRKECRSSVSKIAELGG